jgi:hypothetical protein
MRNKTANPSVLQISCARNHIVVVFEADDIPGYPEDVIIP